jgi:phosphate transport system substrate-binding protein
VSELTLDHLRTLFGGAITNWREVGGDDAAVEVISKHGDSGTRTFLLDEFLRVTLTEKAEVVTSYQMIASLVSSRKHAVSYLRCDLALGNPKLRPVAVMKDPNGEGVPLTLETVQQGAYPIMRPLIFAYEADSKIIGAIENFVRFCRDKESQQGSLSMTTGKARAHDNSQRGTGAASF